MKIPRTQALGETLAVLIATDGATIREACRLRGLRRPTVSFYAIFHKLRDAGLIRVCGRGWRQQPRYCLTQLGIRCWEEMLRADGVRP